ncbi:MAG: fatty acid desaturase, partial [Crocinitomicaceae bacterium]|nr:fatty acid desaturase [Crocinitomicaceae bacterium]
NVLHHTFTNVEGFDEDIDAPVKLLRFSPHTEWRPVHKYQYLYAWFFYSMMTIMWFATKDYKQARRYSKMGLVSSQGKSLVSHWVSIIAGKLVYAIVFLVLPLIFAPVFWPYVLLGFVIKQVVSGLILALIFQPAHVIPDTSFEKPGESGDIEADAKVHQLLTTANYGVRSKWFTWLVGGLNFQVEHHLFPTICHVHYRGISEIVRSTALEYNIPYYSNRTFFSALKAHGKMLKMLGQKDCPAFVNI